jgi:predicted unusual protein kinase regulating ubiquinone biosynthesis (AarF/ABC1/UbiB family)
MNNAFIDEWGRDWRSSLLEFDERPFAAASIGQVS